MIVTQAPNHYKWTFSNFSAPATAVGTTVTPGASNAEGTATDIALGSDLTTETYGILFQITGGGTSAASKMQLMDIGVDPTGGTSYTYMVNNLPIGSSLANITQGSGIVFFLPLKIPSGSRVAVRIQGSNATAGTVIVGATFFGKPSRPEAAWAGTYSETIGTITNSDGPTFVPGTSAAEGTWTLVGATVRRLCYLLALVQLDDSSTNTQILFFDIAHGTAGSKTIIAENLQLALPGTSEVTMHPLVYPNLYCDVPAGENLYIRGSINIATADSSYNTTIVGVG